MAEAPFQTVLRSVFVIQFQTYADKITTIVPSSLIFSIGSLPYGLRRQYISLFRMSENPYYFCL